MKYFYKLLTLIVITSFTVLPIGHTVPVAEAIVGDVDNDGIPNSIDLDSDNDGIPDINELCMPPLVGTTPESDALNYRRDNINVFAISNNTNGLGWQESGWEQAVFNKGTTIINRESPNALTGVTGDFSTGTMTLTPVTTGLGPIDWFNTTDGDRTSGSDDGTALRWRHPSGSGGAVDGNWEHETDIDFNAGSNVTAFSFDLNDHFDTNNVIGGSDGVRMEMEINVDGVDIFYIFTPYIGDDAVSGQAGAPFVAFEDGNGNVIEPNGIVGENIETNIGIIKDAPISNVNIKIRAFTTAAGQTVFRDPASIDNFTFASTNLCDTDGDGIANYLDLDSDDDGISDIIEAGGTDTDGDGQVDYPTPGDPTTMVDADNDGLEDSLDNQDSGSGAGEVTTGTPLPLTNTDGTGNPDWIDIDSDDDGITDNTEAQTTAGFQAPLGTDTDNDGLDDRYDGDDQDTVGIGGGAGTVVTPTNTDGAADNPDYRDLDSDDDGENDTIEAYDTNDDGTADTVPANADDDDDGLDDNFDSVDLAVNPDDNPDDNGETPSTFPNDDAGQAGGEPDWRDIDPVLTIQHNTLATLTNANQNSYPVTGTCFAVGDPISTTITDGTTTTPAVTTTCQTGETFSVNVNISGLDHTVSPFNATSTITNGTSASDTDPIDTDTDDDGNPNITDPNPTVPTATNDATSTAPLTAVTFDILANDDYLDNDDINNAGNTTITRRTGADAGTAAGTVSFNNATGEITYTPIAGETGTAPTVGYEVCNDASGANVCATATATINIVQSSSRRGGSRRSRSAENTKIVSKPAPVNVSIETSTTPAVIGNICPIFTQHLKVGDKDGQRGLSKQEVGVSPIINEIRQLQVVLKNLGFYNGSIDGSFGPATKSAVNVWQVANRAEVLDPWGLSGPTGWFYKSSERWMNISLGCTDSVTLDTGKFLENTSTGYTYNPEQAPAIWQGTLSDWQAFLSGSKVNSTSVSINTPSAENKNLIQSLLAQIAAIQAQIAALSNS